MNLNNITRDLILLDLYQADKVFYFAPNSPYLSAITASVFINLILNNKIVIKGNYITIVDETSTRPYNKALLEYLSKSEKPNLTTLAQDLFIDSEFSFSLFELVIHELYVEKLVDISTKKRLIVTKHKISLCDRESVRESYQKLYQTLFKENESKEMIALVLIIDTFLDIREFFDKEEYVLIDQELSKLKETEVYQDIKAFKTVIDEFYLLISSNRVSYFGI